MRTAWDDIEWHSGPPAVLRPPVVPLAIGIAADLIKRSKSPEKAVREAVGAYCRCRPYLAALMTDQAVRYDADRKAGEIVTPTEKQVAATFLQYKMQRKTGPNAALPTLRIA